MKFSQTIFVCPRCQSNLQLEDLNKLFCPVDDLHYSRVGGIWRFLPPERETYFDCFVEEYETVRRLEGRGAKDSAYYRGLPFEDVSGRFTKEWRIRAASFQSLLEHILKPWEIERTQPLLVLDLGAGNGWLSNRISQRGHRVFAVDLIVNAYDGLGAFIHYDTVFTPVQAEFDRLPFPIGFADLIVFNASFHYSTDYVRTLEKALRALSENGRIIILDSPVYSDPASGEQMVREREANFQRLYGFPSNSLPNENYLTYNQLEVLGQKLNLRWRKITPNYGLRWSIRPLIARIRGGREPAKFHLLIGERY